MPFDCLFSRRQGLRLAQALASAVALALVSTGHALAADTVVSVQLDQAKLMKYPANTETIVVGNPVIADVTMLKNSGLVVLTGRGFGQTNLVFLDRDGAVLSQSNLRVVTSGGTVTVQRGADRETLSCNPRCEPTVTLGDASSYMKDSIANITARNGLAVPSAAPH